MILRVWLMLGLMIMPGCSSKEVPSAATKPSPPDPGVILVLYWRWHPQFDSLVVLRGREAFAQHVPFRSVDPPTDRVQADSLPTALVEEAWRWSCQRADTRPFYPGEVKYWIGRVEPGGTDINWRRFRSPFENLEEFLTRLHSAVMSLGRPVDTAPLWVSTTPVNVFANPPDRNK